MTSSPNRRLSPDELLRRLETEERGARRGRLKVFLGYASRVGKSFRMLDEGRRRSERGEDVVVASVQSKVTPDVAALLARLEKVPMLREVHGGRAYDVLDLAALFRRHPQVCLIDELASDNPPGSRNPSRWQDVNDLLDQGIGVITAVNLQHVEERLDEVERITGKRATATVPGDFLRGADELVLVDAAEDAPRMAALRELALLFAADAVEAKLKEYLEAHGMAQTWGVHERILVCLTPRSDAAEMLSSGRRNADRFHGDLLACHVAQPNLGEADRERLRANLDLARQCGASVHSLPGRDFVAAILAFAREQRVTQIFIGHTLTPARVRLFRPPVERLIEEAGEFDVRLFPHPEAS